MLLFDEPGRIDLRLIGNYTPKLCQHLGSGPSAPLGLDGTLAGGGSSISGVPRHKFTDVGAVDGWPAELRLQTCGSSA
jgi:hypothetical protein